MLDPIVLSAPVVLPGGPAAEFLAPLAAAARRRESVSEALTGLVAALGFEHFTYRTVSVPTAARESRAYFWTNLPAAWVERYDQMGYVEVDPRAAEATASTAPVPWDRHTFPETTRRREFFDDAARHGLCSGVAVALRDPDRAPSSFCLSCGLPRLDDRFRAHCAERQGEILLLAQSVHAMLTAGIVDRELPPPTEGAPLSPREQACLQLAAKGLHSRHIATTLGLGERTIHIHFGSVLAKLDARNRHHAVAKAVAAGLVDP